MRHSCLGERGDFDKSGIAAPVIGHQLLLLKLLADLHRVGVRVVALVDRNDDGNLGGLGVA